MSRSSVGLIAMILAANTACGSIWVPVDVPECDYCPTGVLRPYFLDVDGDGFGDPAEDFKMLAEADTTARYTARNDLDCDDSDPNITGQTAAICPIDLVPGLRGDDVVGVVTDGAEFAVIRGAAATSNALHAEAACVAWGGALAVFRSTGELAAVRDAVGAGPFAGFVGIRQDPAGDACSAGGVCWSWTDPAGVAFPAIGWCDGLAPGNAQLERAALLHRGAEWCLGAPDAVDGYSWYKAHFICERPIPERVEWWPPAEDE